MDMRLAGFNLFKQWSIAKMFVKSFSSQKSTYFSSEDNELIDIEILQIAWSYNLIRINNKLYLTGLHCGFATKNEINIPQQLKLKECIVSGNENYILILDCNERTAWKCDIDCNAVWKWKCVNPFYLSKEKSNSNTSFTTDSIKFIALSISCTMCLCLSNDGSLYNIPLKIDVTHCIGKVIDVRCGNEHAIILTNQGYVYTWGNGRRCQLGHGDLQNYDEPQMVEALAGIRVKHVCAGGWHCCAVSDSGDLYVWGWNESGQLGIRQSSYDSPLIKKQKTYDSSLSLAVPTLVELYHENVSENPFECNIVDVQCGSKHTVIMLNDNTLWGSGSNRYGQLGMDNVEKLTIFKKIYSNDSKCKVKCGPWTTLISTLNS